MAYFSQDDKKAMAPKVKEICKKYGISASVAVRHRSTFVLNIKGGKIDFINNFNKIAGAKHHGPFPFVNREKNIDVNTYWYHEHFDGKALDFLKEIVDAMKGPDYFDRTDIRSDYFDQSHYIDVNIGSYDKPYVYAD